MCHIYANRYLAYTFSYSHAVQKHEFMHDVSDNCVSYNLQAYSISPLHVEDNS